MKYLVLFSRLFVGAVFTFSGFIKLQDPVGTKIKMHEYFDVFAADLPTFSGIFGWFSEHAIYFSIFICALELILGLALLIGYKLKTTTWILLLVVVYFAFLTFYSAYFNKVTDCGCFGDFMKLKPWTSFWKDIVLMVFILFMLWQQKYLISSKTGLLMALIVASSLAIGMYCNYFLPIFDFLPYKIGSNIAANMKPSEALRFNYEMTKNGETKIFDKYPTDTTWKYKAMNVLNEEAKPKITDYALWNSTGDFTQESFIGNKMFFIIQNIGHTNEKALPEMMELAKKLEEKGVKVAILTSSVEADFKLFVEKNKISIPYYFADEKVLKTIARVNPTAWILKNGVVVGKWSGYALPELENVLAKLK